MAFARLLRNLVRDPAIGPLVAPIVPDEARTFGLEPIIAEAKIYAPEGQRYTPVDADLPLRYAESTSGQLLQEGITEAGAMASFTALATAYATWGQPDAAGLPLLLDVRLPAGRRPALGPRRHAGPGHPGRLHRRPHHPAGRGAPARRRPLAPAGLRQPGRRHLRPRLRLRDGRDRGGRRRPDPRSRPRGPLLVPHPLQRELPHAAAARGARGRRGARRASSGASTASPGRPRSGPATGPGRPPLLLGTDVAGGHGGPRDSWPRTGGCRPTPGPPPRGPSSAHDALAAERWNRLHPGADAAHPRRHRGPRPRGGPGGGRHRLHPGRARPGGPLGAPARSPRSAPTASAAPTPGPPSAGYFEVDAAHVVVAALGLAGRPRARPSPPRWPAAIAAYGIDPEAAAPFSA